MHIWVELLKVPKNMKKFIELPCAMHPGKWGWPSPFPLQRSGWLYRCTSYVARPCVVKGWSDSIELSAAIGTKKLEMEPMGNFDYFDLRTILIRKSWVLMMAVSRCRTSRGYESQIYRRTMVLHGLTRLAGFLNFPLQTSMFWANKQRITVMYS